MRHDFLTWTAGNRDIPRNPPDDRRVHPAADMGRLPAYPAIPGKAGLPDCRNADAVRPVPLADKLPVADTGMAAAVASAAVQAGCIPVAAPVSVAVHDIAAPAVAYTGEVAAAVASVRLAAMS